jgi:hypothetical protein
MPQDVQTAPPPPAASDATTEHFSHLHKMSTTAGVTNQDYVAVNPLAVVAALVGIASGLAFAGWLLLVIPAVGVVFALVAIWQIGNSNGTQTGRGLAILGLALCLLCAGGMMVQRYMGHASLRNDTNAISDAISQTGKLIRSGDYRKAYDQYDAEFKRYIPFEQFQQVWQGNQAYIGKLETMEWNGITPAFESAGGAPMAATKAKIKFEKGQEERCDVILRVEDGKWRINAMPQFFKPKAPQKKPADQFTDPRLG